MSAVTVSWPTRRRASSTATNLCVRLRTSVPITTTMEVASPTPIQSEGRGRPADAFRSGGTTLLSSHSCLSSTRGAGITNAHQPEGGKDPTSQAPDDQDPTSQPQQSHPVTDSPYVLSPPTQTRSREAASTKQLQRQSARYQCPRFDERRLEPGPATTNCDDATMQRYPRHRGPLRDNHHRSAGGRLGRILPIASLAQSVEGSLP